MTKICGFCGSMNPARLDWCTGCGRVLPVRLPRAIPVVSVLKALAAGLVIAIALIALLSLQGCMGAPFTANEFELSSAGAGGDINTMSEAGAGAGKVDSDGDAGQAGDAAVVGASGGAGGERPDPIGTGGRAAGAGGRGMGTGGSSGAASAASAASGGSGEPGGSGGSAGACYVTAAWRNTPCDTCSSAVPSSGRTCAQVLDCYAAHPGKEFDCDYNEPTQDLQVELARAVLDCRCAK